MNIFKLHRSIGFWAVMLLLLALALQYTGGLYIIELTRFAKEKGLENHMADLGRLASTVLNQTVDDLHALAQESTWAENPDLFVSDSPPDPDTETYLAGLDSSISSVVIEFAERSRLSSIVILDRSGMILFHTDDPDQILEFWPYDQPWVKLALDGQTSSPPAYPVDNLMFKRFYIPMKMIPNVLPGDLSTSSSNLEDKPPGSEDVNALICLVAGRDYLGEIKHLTRSVHRTAFILTLLLALIGYLIYRIMQQQRKVERQASEADRLASLGTLAAGFAHELRNPLGIIRAFIEDLEHSLRNHQKPEGSIDLCGDIIEETDRMNHLISQFLEYSHDNRRGSNACVLESIRSVRVILSPTAEKKGVQIDIQCHIPNETPQDCRASINPDSLKQVILNLLMNAIEMSGRETRILCNIGATTRQVTIAIRDEGPGIPPGNAKHIFEPFYSTRPGGSGLGLAVCRRIVQDYGGTLNLDTSYKLGALFVIRLPRTKGRADPSDKQEVIGINFDNTQQERDE